MPALLPVWNAPEPQRLTMIAERQGQWILSAVAFAISVVLVAVGLGAVSAALARLEPVTGGSPGLGSPPSSLPRHWQSLSSPTGSR